jgi:hypothetical protein
MQAFHVRCAMDKKLIDNWEAMDDQREDEDAYECYIFCSSHKEQGKKDLKQGGKSRLSPTSV